MRQRSKSVCLQTSTSPFLLEAEEGEIGQTEWAAEEQLKIIAKIKEQIPLRDNMPFDKRIKTIDWEKIEIDSKTGSDIAQQFQLTLNKVKTFRVLPEILRDLEKLLLTTLPIKKPISSFALFIQENKSQILKEKINCDESYTKTASSIYRALTDEERESLSHRSEQIKKEYKELITKLHLDNGYLKSIHTPKKNMDTPFGDFWLKKKNVDPNANYRRTRKEYGTLSNAKKLKYILKFLGVKNGNMLNLEQFNKAKLSLVKEEMALINEYEKKPKKLSAYTLYMKTFLNSSKSTKNRMNWNFTFKSAGSAWKNLTEKEKEKFQKQAAELKTKYDEKYESYFNSLPEERQILLLRTKKNECNNMGMSLEDAIKASQETGIYNSIDSTLYNAVAAAKTNKAPKRKNTNNGDGEVDEIPTKKKPSNFTIKLASKSKKKKNNENDHHIESETPHENDHHIESETPHETESIPTPVKKKKNTKVENNEMDDHNDESAYRIETESTPVIIAKKKKTKIPNNSSQESLNATTALLDTNTSAEFNSDFIKKPPRSLYTYFVLKEYTGKRNKSKKAFKALTQEDRNNLLIRYEKSKRKYLKKFQKYISSMEEEEIALNCKRIYEERNEDEDISDITDEE